MGRLDDIDVGSDGVGGMLFLNVSEDGDVLSTDGLAVAQKVAGTGIDIAFVRHMTKDKPLGADEVGVGGQCGGKGFTIGPSQDLDAEGHGGMGLFNGAGNDAHGRHNLWAGLAQIGEVMHVFDHQGMDARRTIHLRLGEGVIDNGGDAARMLRAAGERSNVDHSDERSGPITKQAGEAGCFHGDRPQGTSWLFAFWPTSGEGSIENAALDIKDFFFEALGNLVFKLVVGGEAYAMVGEGADVTGAAPKLIFHRS